LDRRRTIEACALLPFMIIGISLTLAFFNLSSGDIIEVNLGSSLGTAEHTLDYVSGGGSLSGGAELKNASVNDIPMIMNGSNAHASIVRRRSKSRQSVIEEYGTTPGSRQQTPATTMTSVY
jgi:hypothetical protein